MKSSQICQIWGYLAENNEIKDICQIWENLAENDKIEQISSIFTKSRSKRWNQAKFVEIGEIWMKTMKSSKICQNWGHTGENDETE